MNKIKRCLLLMQVLVLIMLSVSLAPAMATNNEKVIRVPFVPLAGFFEMDERGNRTGYGAEYLTEIGIVSGYRIEYVDFKSWDASVKGFYDGKVDAILPVEFDEKTRYDIELTRVSIVDTSFVLLGKKGRNDLYYNDAAGIRNVRVGAKKSELDKLTSKEKKDIGITSSNVTYYDTFQQLSIALHKNKVDAIFTNIINYSDEYEMLADTHWIKNYIAMKKGDKRITDIEDAMETISLQSGYFANNLREKYFHNINMIPFTKEEELFVDEHKVIKVGVLGNRKPIVYYDSKTKKARGIIIDIMDKVAEKTGLNIKYEVYKGEKELSEALSQHKVDMAIPYSGKQYYGDGVKLVKSVSMFGTFVNLENFGGNKKLLGDKIRVGVPKERRSEIHFLERSNPKFEVVVFDNELEELNALKVGEIDAIAHDTFTISMLNENPRYDGIEIIPSYMYYVECNGVSLCQDKILIEIINKGLERFKVHEKEEVVNNYITYASYEMTIGDYVYKYWKAFLFFSIIIEIIVIAVIFYNKKKEEYYKDIEQKNIEVLAANKAKNDFMSRMSHDLRTPMNAIIGLSDNNLVTSKEYECKEMMDKINHAGKYMLSLVNDILDFAKIENGNLHINNGPLRYMNVKKNIDDIIFNLAAKSGLTYKSIFDGNENTTISIDGLRLEQICINLLNNTVKFTKSGGHISIKVTQEIIGEKALLKICVEDNGIGMSEEFQKTMFDPFEQENRGDFCSDKGTGLGLTIIKELVELMKGKISVRSEINGGTRFDLEFLCDVLEKDGKYIATKENYEELRGKRILVVEDHPVNLVVAKKVLEKVGMIVESCSNGDEAILELSKSEPGYYDCILMDIRMPVKDGIQASKEIRSMDRADGKTIPIIAMSANTFEDDKIRSKEAGINVHLSKPIDSNELYYTLKKLL
ncbi:MAG: transporter substrate-binding domain-containing protein [Anaerovoracaceae bacterium]